MVSFQRIADSRGKSRVAHDVEVNIEWNLQVAAVLADMNQLLRGSRLSTAFVSALQKETAVFVTYVEYAIFVRKTMRPALTLIS